MQRPSLHDQRLQKLIVAAGIVILATGYCGSGGQQILSIVINLYWLFEVK